MKTRLFVLLLAIGVFSWWLGTQPLVEPAVVDAQPESLANPPDSFFETRYILQPSPGFTLVKDTTMERVGNPEREPLHPLMLTAQMMP